MRQEAFDLAIIGGGPAGALLAALSARNGKSVLLLEASTHDKRKICGEYLCPKAVELLEELGFPQLLQGRPVQGMRLFSPSGLSVESSFPNGASGITSRRDILDPALLAAAAAEGVEIRRGARLDNFQYREGRWNLMAGKETFSARLLVGADGRQSFVARKLGVNIPVAAKRVALHLFAQTQQETSAWGEMHILPDGSYVGISPAGMHELNLSLVISAEKLKGRSAHESFRASLALSENLRQRFLPLADSSPVFTAYPVSHAVSEVAGETWALVGDAAGFLDPLTGEGIFQALQSASQLANCLTYPGMNLAQRLSLYARTHRHALKSKTRVNRFFQKLIQHPRACDWVGRKLRSRPARANAFIGIVGNVHSPVVGLRKMIFARS